MAKYRTKEAIIQGSEYIPVGAEIELNQSGASYLGDKVEKIPTRSKPKTKAVEEPIDSTEE